MKKEQQLHQLIHAMSSSEQRDYIKHLKASIGKEPKRLMQLFSVLKNVFPYDSNKIDKKLQAESFSTQPHRIRNYLYSSIINFLDRPYSDDSHAEILRLLRHAHLLKGKKLYDQCFNLLNRIDIICQDYRKYHFALEALEIRKSVEAEQHLKYSQMASHTEEMLPIAVQLTEIIRARLVCYKMLDMLYQKGQLDKDVQKAQYFELYQEVIMRKDYLKKEPVFYLAQQVYGIMTHDYGLAEKASERLFEFAIHTPQLLKDMAEAIKVSHNHANFYLVRDRFDDTEKVIELMVEHLGSKKMNTETRSLYDITINLTELAIMVYDHQNRFNHERHQQIQTFFLERESRLSSQHRYGFYAHNAVICLYEDDPSRALQYINKLVNEPAFLKLGEMVASRINLLNMTVHWRMKNHDLLENLVFNRKRRIRVSNLKHTEEILITYYKLASEGVSLPDWRINLLNALQTGERNNQKEMRTFGMDYVYYFGSVIKN